MNGFMKRIERIKAALDVRQPNLIILVFEDGSQTKMGTLEAIDELCKRQDIVDVISDDDTTASLLRAMIGPMDFSDLEELQE